MQRVVTINFPPLGRVKIDGVRSIALVSCEAPRLVIRERSDAFNIFEGQSLPISGPVAEIVNPYPVMISAAVAYNAPIAAPAPSERGSVLQYPKIVSYINLSVGPAVDKKSGAGFIMRRGAALVRFINGDAIQTNVIRFPSASVDFMAYQPAGAWQTSLTPRFLDGTSDTSTVIKSGTYTDADVAAWLIAANYIGPQQYEYTTTPTDGRLYHRIDTETAIFMGRNINQGIPIFAEVIHLGLETGDYD